MNEASRVMHELDSETYPAADSWVKGTRERADISPNDLAERCKELTARRGEGIDDRIVQHGEGEFVARRFGNGCEFSAELFYISRNTGIIIYTAEFLDQLRMGILAQLFFLRAGNQHEVPSAGRRIDGTPRHAGGQGRTG